MEIPECLVADILVRLPIKSILRFKAVCKSWYAILSNPEFSCTDLFTVDPDDHILYKHHQDWTDEVFSLISLNNLDHVSPTQKLPIVNPTANCTCIAGCCNGIVLLQDGFVMCLWNPATQETKDLPELKLLHDLKNVGFCYDAKTGDFKVIVIFSDRSKLKQDFVYSLRSDSWKIVKPQSPKAEYYSTNDEIGMNSSNGMCHWFGSYLVDNRYEDVILSFDANDEIFKTTIIPYNHQVPFYKRDRGRGFFMVKDYVAMFYETEKGTEMYEIWVMLEVGVKESWIKVMTIGPTLNFFRYTGFGQIGRFFFIQMDGVTTEGVRNLLLYLIHLPAKLPLFCIMLICLVLSLLLITRNPKFDWKN